MEKKRRRRGTLAMMTRYPATPPGGGDAGRGVPAPRKKASREANALAASVGSQIRTLRRTADMTTVELARRANLSNGMLSKVERGTTLPSFATIIAIAKALEVPVARLFASFGDRRDFSMVKAGQGLMVDRRGAKKGHTYQLLGHLLSGEIFVEPYLITLNQSATDHASYQHTGVEFVHVVSGRMHYRYADRIVEVGPGDSLLYDANAVHGPEEILSAPVTYLSICINLRA